jgi:hypothetical protein
MKCCPFCKSPDVFVWECEDTSVGCSTYWVECECGARGPISEYKEGAELYWNGAASVDEAATLDRADKA